METWSVMSVEQVVEWATKSGIISAEVLKDDVYPDYYNVGFGDHMHVLNITTVYFPCAVIINSQKYTENEVDGESLLLLSDKDIDKMFPKTGPRSKFRNALCKLKEATAPAELTGNQKTTKSSTNLTENQEATKSHTHLTEHQEDTKPPTNTTDVAQINVETDVSDVEVVESEISSKKAKKTIQYMLTNEGLINKISDSYKRDFNETETSEEYILK